MASDPSRAGVPSADEWNQWRRQVFGDPYLVWHDGPDFTVLVARARADLEAVGRMLVAGLRERDPLAAQAFGYLGPQQVAPGGAVDLLRAAAETAQDEFLIRLAEALFVLTGDPSWANPIVSVLSDAQSEFVRLDAAIALAQFAPTARLVQALAHAVCDPDYLVRYHAANTLLRYAGVDADVSDDSGLFTNITAEADRGRWQAAADHLSAQIPPQP